MEKKTEICPECMKILQKLLIECTDGMFRTIDYKEFAKLVIELITWDNSNVK